MELRGLRRTLTRGGVESTIGRARERADFESIIGSFYDTYDALDDDMAVKPTLWRSDGIREALEV